MTMYLIIKETKFTNESLYHVVSFTDNLDKANDMLQGYNLIEKDKKNWIFAELDKEQSPDDHGKVKQQIDGENKDLW